MKNKFAHDSHLADYEKKSIKTSKQFCQNYNVKKSDIMCNFSKIQNHGTKKPKIFKEKTQKAYHQKFNDLFY